MRAIFSLVLLCGCSDFVPTEPDPVVEQAPVAQEDRCGQWFSGAYVVDMHYVQVMRDNGYELCPR
jgi:hypothetical protein